MHSPGWGWAAAAVALDWLIRIGLSVRVIHEAAGRWASHWPG